MGRYNLNYFFKIPLKDQQHTWYKVVVVIKSRLSKYKLTTGVSYFTIESIVSVCVLEASNFHITLLEVEY